MALQLHIESKVPIEYVPGSAIERRFWAKVRKTATCWLWTASLRNKGYGAFAYREANGDLIQERAHRFSYKLHKGPIPVGVFVLHRCDVPACVNPDHLFLGTNTDNVRDMVAKGRRVVGGAHCGVANAKYERGERHHASKLTAEQVREMRHIHAGGGMSYSEIGKMFDIHATAAFKIVKRMLWKHI